MKWMMSNTRRMVTKNEVPTMLMKAMSNKLGSWTGLGLRSHMYCLRKSEMLSRMRLAVRFMKNIQNRMGVL